jgi:hypothetical protein
MGRTLLCSALIGVLLTAGCSHDVGGSTSQLPSVPQSVAGAATRSAKGIVSTNGSTSTVTATIEGGTASEFNVNAGSGCGMVNVTTTGSTTWSYNGLTISAGTPVTFTATGSCATSFAASSVTLGTSSGNPNVSGTIVAVSGNTININGGSGCGMVNVTYISSTTINYNGYALSSGVPISVWGSGSCSTSFSAQTITLGPLSSSSPNLTGTIAAVSGNTINVNGGSGCGLVDAVYSSSTTINYNGYTLSVGTPIQVWGSGSCATQFTATTITLGSGGSGQSGSTISQKHVLTADYLGGADGSNTVSAATAATVLSWVEASPENGTTYSAAGMKTMVYVDPFRQATTDPLYSSDSSTFSKNCSGADIKIAYKGITMYLMNPASSDLETKMNTWQTDEKAAGHVDAFFYDDIDTLYGTTVPCDMTQSTWDSENSAFIATSKNPVVFNGYGMNSDAAKVINVSPVLGGVVEGCYATGSQSSPPYTTGSAWTADENLELAAAAVNKLFFCYNTGAQVGSSYTALRSYIFASFLLSYNATSSVLWDTFTTSSDVHVFPETEIVPTSPLVSAPSSIGSLESSSGLYVREYSACYLAGASIGQCAAVVNSSASSSAAMPALKQSYSHTMAISGAGVLDGGSVSVTGSKAPTTIPAETGYVLTQ